jgi:hypothetical protein
MRLRFALLFILTVALVGCIQTYREREQKAGEEGQEPVLVPNTPSFKEFRHIFP